MNYELLQKHACSNVFKYPEGLQELMSDITREVLREQPAKLYEFIANYLSVLLITREHGILAVKLLDDLCDCRPSVSEHLMQIGIEEPKLSSIANIIKQEIKNLESIAGQETVLESSIIKKVLLSGYVDEETVVKVCQVARNAYREYTYRKKVLEKRMTLEPEAPWEIAVKHTLDIYKTTKPSFSDLNRATERIQAAYKGYYTRKKEILKHLEKPKFRPKQDLPGPPLDIAGSRVLALGPVVDLQVPEDSAGIEGLFDADEKARQGRYDPLKSIAHINDLSARDHSELAQIPKGLQSRLQVEDTDAVDRRTSQLPETPNVSKESLRKGISFPKVPTNFIQEEAVHELGTEMYETEEGLEMEDKGLKAEKGSTPERGDEKAGAQGPTQEGQEAVGHEQVTAEDATGAAQETAVDGQTVTEGQPQAAEEQAQAAEGQAQAAEGQAQAAEGQPQTEEGQSQAAGVQEAGKASIPESAENQKQAEIAPETDEDGEKRKKSGEIYVEYKIGEDIEDGQVITRRPLMRTISTVKKSE